MFENRICTCLLVVFMKCAAFKDRMIFFLVDVYFILITLQDLKTILDTADNGVVYFSLGSVIKSSKMPRETASLLLSELAKLNQTVLWKWEDDRLPTLPSNVIVRKWFPQNDILGTPPEECLMYRSLFIESNTERGRLKSVVCIS